MTFAQDFAVIEARPVPTDEQTEAARRVVEAHAPDLIAAIFGETGGAQ